MVEMIGSSEKIKDMLNLIERVAPSNTNVLIVGESGTGKELVAKMLHENGPTKDKPFVPINCGAIPENLLESEFFGHVKGSFTGAGNDKAGLFEAANGGTIFLDEVGELHLSMQVKLLRAIQEKVVRRVGGTKTIAVSARIVAATNRNLEEAIKDGSFRDDLYYRLNVISIRTPPLRDRVSDILLLMNFFLKKMNTKVRKTVKGFEPSVQKAFENYRWPGNVRELENVIERAVALESADLITLDALPKQIQDAAIDRSGPPGFGSMDTTRHEEFIKVPSPNFYSGPIDLEKILGDLERTYITAALKHSGGVKKKAAELLGVTFRSIRYRLEKLGIDD